MDSQPWPTLDQRDAATAFVTYSPAQIMVAADQLARLLSERESAAYQRGHEAGVRDEREACAKLAEEFLGVTLPQRVANQIRERQREGAEALMPEFARRLEDLRAELRRIVEEEPDRRCGPALAHLVSE